ncbi:MAG: PTS sugar transporter subunit IIC [Longimicrobiales bacterium]
MPLTVLAALLAVEGTSIGQFMVSRPLVAAGIAGMVLGNPEQGLIVGALRELFFLPAVPIGGGRYPEPGPAAVVAAYAASVAGGAGAVAFGVFFGLSFGLIGGWSQQKVRAVVTRLLPTSDDPGLGPRLAKAHLASVALDALRGGALAAFGMVLVRSLVPVFAATWPLDGNTTLVLLLLCACLPLGSLLSTIGGVRRRGAWTLAGVALGGVLGSLI